MQVYTNSNGVEFCVVSGVVIRTVGGLGVVNISGIKNESLVKGIQAGIFTFHSTLTAKEYVTLANAVKYGVIK